MGQILEPLLTEVVTTTPTVSVLTSINIDLDLERTKAAALIVAAGVGFDPTAYVTADDLAWALVGRPDYAVQTATDLVEPWRDPDFITGQAQRFNVVTTGGGIVPSSYQLDVPGGGYLTTRRLSFLIFDDNASIEWSVRVWYKLVILTSKEIEDFFFLRR